MKGAGNPTDIRMAVRRLGCLRKYPNGRPYRGRWRADPIADAVALTFIRLDARAIGEASMRLAVAARRGKAP